MTKANQKRNEQTKLKQAQVNRPLTEKIYIYDQKYMKKIFKLTHREIQIKRVISYFFTYQAKSL